MFSFVNVLLSPLLSYRSCALDARRIGQKLPPLSSLLNNRVRCGKVALRFSFITQPHLQSCERRSSWVREAHVNSCVSDRHSSGWKEGWVWVKGHFAEAHFMRGKSRNIKVKYYVWKFPDFHILTPPHIHCCPLIHRVFHSICKIFNPPFGAP